jgi:hypothetical protein
VSFHREVSTSGRWLAGDVVRLFEGGPFGDGVVLGFDDDDNALVQRPYAYASCVGTTGPTVLLGSEKIVYASLDRLTKVGGARRTA